jgi:PAS domain S-box-containing protein
MSVETGKIWMGNNGRISDCSPKFAAWLGFEQEALENLPITALIPPEFQSSHNRAFSEYKKHGEKTIMGSWVDVSIMNADGHQLPVKLCVTEDDGLFVGLFEYEL